VSDSTTKQFVWQVDEPALNRTLSKSSPSALCPYCPVDRSDPRPALPACDAWSNSATRSRSSGSSRAMHTPAKVRSAHVHCQPPKGAMNSSTPEKTSAHRHPAQQVWAWALCPACSGIPESRQRLGTPQECDCHSHRCGQKHGNERVVMGTIVRK